MANVGLTITEGVNNGVSPFRDASKRNIGLAGQFNRGGAFKATKITSMEDFNVIFGGQNDAFYGPRIVKSIFDEAGDAPVTLYLARMVAVTAKAATATVNLDSGSSVTMMVNAAYKGTPDPGAWANGITVTLYSYGSLVRDMFSLIVQYKTNTPEQYNYGTLAEIQDAVNKVSKYVTVTFNGEIEKMKFKDVTGTVTANTSSNEVTGSGTTFTSLKVGNVLYDSNGKLVGTIAAIASATKLTLTSRAITAVEGAAVKVREDKTFVAKLANGVDGEITENDYKPGGTTDSPTGLAAFDGFDVQIIGVTEYHSLSMAKVLHAYCKEQKNAIGICNLPLNADEGTAELYAMEFQTSGISYLCSYMEWCTVPDDSGNPVMIPVMGPVLGAGFIRTPYLQGDFIHIPPAGIDSLFNNVMEMIPQRLSQTVINKLVQQFSCNIIQYVENTGYYIGSSRTYSTNDLYKSIHVRLQTSYYVRSLNSKMCFLEQKPNTPELKREALVEARNFFKTEYDNGALERSVDFDTAYQGICDKSNNPNTQDRKLLNIDILWIPTECTESVHISLLRNDSVLTTTETEE